MNILEQQINDSEDQNVKMVGAVLKEICKLSADHEEIILQDLEVEEMSLEKCFQAIYNHAKENQTNGCFAAPVFGIDMDNPIIKIIFDFYKLPISEKEERETVSLLGLV